MNAIIEGTQPRTQKWGWGALLVICALLTLNGVALFFISASPSTFEQDTGVPIDEVRQAFPTVADHVVREGQSISILLAGLGLLALVVALAGYRRGSRWAWNAMWVLVGLLTVLTVWSIAIGGRFDIGGFYLVLAVLTLAGQLLAGRGMGG